MQSSRPDASTSLLTIFFSRAVSPSELNGMCTRWNFATRCAKSGATTSFEEIEALFRGVVFFVEFDCDVAPRLARPRRTIETSVVFDFLDMPGDSSKGEGVRRRRCGRR